MEYRIGLISTYPELTTLARQVAEEQGEHIEIGEGISLQALDIARQQEAKGIEVIITSGLNVEYLRQRIATPVVAIPITTFDLMCTLEELRHEHERIAVYQYARPNPRLKKIERMLTLNLLEMVFQDAEDARQKLAQAHSMGVTIHVGGALTCSLSQEMGLLAIPFDIRKETVFQAVENAQEVAYVRRKEKREAVRLQAIIDFAYEGIIATDSSGRITVVNPVAQKALKISGQQALGKPLGSLLAYPALEKVLKTGEPLLAEIQNIGENTMVLNCVPIVVDDRVQGAVINFQDAAGIQKLENKIRREIYSKGYSAKFRFTDIIGESPAIRKTVFYGKRFGTTDETVLITGESGVGKELFAQSIHNFSHRSHRSFVAINCAAIPSNLLESELFGYADGAFTGAKKGGKPGLFELAHKGTIFLDEIGDISIDLQARLLRVLQEREVMRLGDNKVLPVDVRVITATNRDLKTEVAVGRFREDLYFRLNVLLLTVPPLRQRREDILLIARNFLERCERGLSGEQISLLMSHLAPLQEFDWPGNVRELENVLRRFVVLSGEALELNESPEKLLREIIKQGSIESSGMVHNASGANAENPGASISRLRAMMGDLQDNIILDEFLKNEQNKSELAKKLGISRTTLWRKLKAYGVSPVPADDPDFLNVSKRNK